MLSFCLALLITTTSPQIKAIYSSLDPYSISQLLAFYTLYPDTECGQSALTKAWQLLGKSSEQSLDLPELDLQPIIALVSRLPQIAPPKLSDQDLLLIETLAQPLANRSLQGHSICSIDKIRDLPLQEIDLSRALFLYQFQEDEKKIRLYEANIDLMALQIRARLSPQATDLEKIRAINTLIFHQLRFRFPPQSLLEETFQDVYTFLPNVMDSRQGVCLGVSILYLCLAQRLDLPLEIITPPGHIYLRCKDTNIETTARGIHIPTERYLSVHTHTLPQKNIRQVIGMSFFNQAGSAFHHEEYQAAIDLYQKALIYCPDDPLTSMLLAYNYLLAGNKTAGRALLQKIQHTKMEGAVQAESLPTDYLAKRVNIDGIKAIFSRVDETRSSIETKRKKIQSALKRYPKFRDGWLHLAFTYLQLGQYKDGLSALESYHRIDPKNVTVEYYLAQLKLARLQPEAAWMHYYNAKALTGSYYPSALRELYHHLRMTYPIEQR